VACGRDTPTSYAPLPAPPLTLTYLQYRALFTTVEHQAIMTVAQSDHTVLD
jgi:hypothetical protein